jgi:hypothetical protein
VASKEDQKRGWDELHQADQAEVERAVGQRVNLPTYGYGGNLLREFG